MIGDELALHAANCMLPRGAGRRRDKFLFVTSQEPTVLWYEGKIHISPHNSVRGHPDYQRSQLGNPSHVVRPDVGPDREDILGRTVPARILSLVASWHGLTVRQLARLLKHTKDEVRKECTDLVQMEWLREHPGHGMLYLGRWGIRYIARVSRVSHQSVSARVQAAFKEDHKEVGGKFRHTMDANDVMIRMVEAGIKVFPGWRACENLPGTQLAPDLAILVRIGGHFGLVGVEVERTAIHPEQVTDKLNPWVVADQSGLLRPSIFLAKNPKAENLFVQQSDGLPIYTTTIAEAKRGPVSGDRTVFRHRGVPQQLLPWDIRLGQRGDL